MMESGIRCAASGFSNIGSVNTFSWMNCGASATALFAVSMVLGIDSLLVHVSHPWILSPQLGKIKAILWRKRPGFKAMELRDARNFLVTSIPSSSYICHMAGAW